MARKSKEIEPIEATLEQVADAMVKSTNGTRNAISNKIKRLDKISPLLPAPSKMVQLPLPIVKKQVEYEGVEMGVLESGIPYLTESGLARMCGIHRKSLSELAVNWNDEKNKERGKKINALLLDLDYDDPTLLTKSNNNGQIVNAYTEPVCMAILEYYAFESNERKKQAQKAYRTLARQTFRKFIYDATGYSPEQKELAKWKHFHDRVNILKSSLPSGYFGIFNESASIVVPLIEAGLVTDDKSVPDISVGIIWGRYWKDNNLESKHGERIKYEHNYPDYFPQAESNPQEPWAYPNSALGDFRKWFNDEYIKNKFPNYLINKAKKGDLAPAGVKKAIDAFKKLELSE